MEIKELTISYGEGRSKNYNTEKHHLSITVLPSEEDLIERPIDKWFYFYDNMLRKAVAAMFGDAGAVDIAPKVEKPAVVEKVIIAQENAKVPNLNEPALEKGYYRLRFDSIKSETDKAYLLIYQGREGWIPKSKIGKIDGKGNWFDVPKWIVEKKFEIPGDKNE
jgi:hypothetical protein